MFEERAAGIKSQDELKAPRRQKPRGRAATSCPPTLDDASVVTDWQQKLINPTQFAAPAAVLVITGHTMSHRAHPVPTATRRHSFFFLQYAVSVHKTSVHFPTQNNDTFCQLERNTTLLIFV